ENTGGVLGAQVLQQLAGGVFQPQHEQQEDHTDVGADRDEFVAGGQREETARAEHEAREQVQRDRRYPDLGGDSSEDAQAEDHPTQFQEDSGRARRYCRITASTAVRASWVPTTIS